MERTGSRMPGNKQGRLTGEGMRLTRQATSDDDYYFKSKSNSSAGRRFNLRRFQGNRYTRQRSGTHGNDIEGFMSFSPPRKKTPDLKPEQRKRKLEEENRMRGKNRMTPTLARGRKLTQPDEQGGIPQNVRYKPYRMVEYLNTIDPATLRRASKGVLKDILLAFDVLLSLRFKNIIRFGWTREIISGLTDAWQRIAPDLRFASKSWETDLRRIQNVEDIITKLLQYKDCFPTELEFDSLLAQKNAEMARARRNI